MTSGTTWAGRLARMLALAAATALTLGIPAPQARAEDPLKLEVGLNAFSATGTKPDDVATLKVSVTNIGSVPAYGVVAHLWRSRDAIRDQGGLTTLSQGGTTLGSWTTGPGSYLQITNSVTAFAPGAVRQFTLSATMRQLGFDVPGAAYPIGVEVVATSDQSSNNTVVAKLHTFLPVPAKGGVPVTSVVLLSAPPTKLAPGVFASDDLSADLTGRLSALLDAIQRSQLNWLVDPALLDEVRDQADGYRVLEDGKLRDGTGQQAAADWLTRFTSLDRSRGARTLFANPDTLAAAAAGNHNVLAWSKTASAAVPDVAGLPLVVLPTGNTLTTGAVNYLAPADAEAVLATNSRVAGALQTSGADVRVLATQTVPEAAAANVTTAITQRQLLLSQTAISGKAGQVRLITGTAGVVGDAAARPSWTSSRTLAATLSQESTRVAELAPTKAESLGRRRLAMLDRLTADLSAYASLVPTSVLASQPEANQLRFISTSWVANPRGMSHYDTAVNNLFGRDAVSDRVHLNASTRLVMSARSNQFPVTITNEAFESVQVRVIVTTDNPQRLSVPPSDLVTVDPGQSLTVNIHPEAASNGVVSAKAHLATADGRRAGEDVPLTIEVTDLGVVAWIIVGVSGVVLVAATGWRIRQVRRRDTSNAKTEET